MTSKTNKYLCIHGHFYQPPRENPWLGAVEYQESARPYHDWNERITRECYGPNACARLHGEDGRILGLINNYEYMSFDFGPTLLSWLESSHPWVYEHILKADRAGQERFNGHGNALAHVYNHIIMPLATRRDKLVQIRWGLADFKHRFKRPAEGMWLAETAVDMETLDLMAREGVAYTILSPNQAHSVRSLAVQGESDQWQDVSGGRIDPTRPYRVRLDKQGRRFIDVFFYDEPLSRAVAYEKILTSGENLLSRIEQAFASHNDGARLVSLATDGESYGHHFKFGDLALAWLFHHLEKAETIKLINYGLYLDLFPPEDEVRIIQNTSWSCAHGIERWRSDCGCSVSRKSGWNQAWRAPLKQGIDWLAHELADIFQERAGRLFKDPWKAREKYIHVFLNPEGSKREGFLKRQARRTLGNDERAEAFQLLESQRMGLFMYTSCGWFFDDISGLEPVQILKYAARAIELVQQWTGTDLEAGLMKFLSRAKSNDPHYRNGERIYEIRVKPSRIDPTSATAHYGLSTLIEGVNREEGLFSEIVRPVSELRVETKGMLAITGEVQVIDTWTEHEFLRAYVAMLWDTGKLQCFAGESIAGFDLERLSSEIRSAFLNEDINKIEEIVCLYLAEARNYGLKDVIPETRKSLIEGLALGLGYHIQDYLRKYDALFKELLFSLEGTRRQGPGIPEDIFPILLADELSRFVDPGPERENIDLTGLRSLAVQAISMKNVVFGSRIRQISQDFLRRQMDRLGSSVPNRSAIENVINFLHLAEKLSLKPDLWETQNMFYELYSDPDFLKSLGQDLSPLFLDLGRLLGFFNS